MLMKYRNQIVDKILFQENKNNRMKSLDNRFLLEN